MHMPSLSMAKEPTKQESRSWWSWGRKNVSRETTPAPETSSNLLELKSTISIDETERSKEHLGKKEHLSNLDNTHSFSSASNFKLRTRF